MSWPIIDRTADLLLRWSRYYVVERGGAQHVYRIDVVLFSFFPLSLNSLLLFDADRQKQTENKKRKKKRSKKEKRKEVKKKKERKRKKKQWEGTEKGNGGGGGGVFLVLLEAVAGFAIWAWINPGPIYPISFTGLFPFNSYMFCRTPQYLTPLSSFQIKFALYPLLSFPSTRAIKGLHRAYNHSSNNGTRYANAKMSATKSASQVIRKRGSTRTRLKLTTIAYPESVLRPRGDPPSQVRGPTDPGVERRP